MLQENQTGFCGVDGSIDSNNSGFTGTGFANSNNSTGSGINWKVNVQNSGNYTFAWRYANGSANNRSANVLVNNGGTQNVSFPGTGAWTAWTETTANVYLAAGENNIRLQATTSEGLANIDWINVGGSGISGADCGGVSPTGCPLNLEGFASLNGGTTGGGNTAPTTVTTLAQLKACATASEARVCRVQGTINFGTFEEIMVRSNKTIIGAGANAEIVNGGFRLNFVENIIIRNLTIRDSFVEGDWAGDTQDNDGVQMDTSNNIWIDHVRFARLGDGMIDSRMDTTNLTVSWNIFEEHNKTFGIGWTDNVIAEITIHHNWFNGTNQRNPSADNILRAHLYNNLMENNASYGNWARGGTNMVLENSVFTNVANPHYYGTGTLVARGNVYNNTTGRAVSTGSTYSFFNPSNFYSYTLDSTSNLKSLLQECAGPLAELGN